MFFDYLCGGSMFLDYLCGGSIFLDYLCGGSMFLDYFCGGSMFLDYLCGGSMFLDSVDYLYMIVCRGSMFLDSGDYLYMIVCRGSMFLDSVDYLYMIVCRGSMFLDYLCGGSMFMDSVDYLYMYSVILNKVMNCLALLCSKSITQNIMPEQNKQNTCIDNSKHWPPEMKTIPWYLYVILGFYCWQDTSVPHSFLATTLGPFPGSTLLTPRGSGTSPRKTGKSIIHLLYKMNSKFGMQCMALHYL